MMDVVTALSGSDMAYVSMIIEAFIADGVKMELSRENLHPPRTVLGAAKQVRTPQLQPATSAMK